MAKRKNRVRAMQHHHGQIESIKTLEPNATPARWRPFSDALLDVAKQALDIARRLEARGAVDRRPVDQLSEQVDALLSLVPARESDDESDEE